MAFSVLTYEYVDDILARRDPHREAHLALIDRFVAEHGLVLAGATGEGPDGALFVFAAESGPADAAAAFVAADPYVEAGLVTDSRIEPWTVVVNAWN
ncbi:MAG TPA: YciI family protein [Solirubrobacterales bacterium]|nr:YciI family protein [Solirubrobacterales bacterium]